MRTKFGLLVVLSGLVLAGYMIQPVVIAQAQGPWGARPIVATKAVADADVAVLSIPDTYTYGLIAIEIENAGDTNALTDFKLQLTDHPDGEWYTYLSGTDWASTTNSNLRFCSSTVPNTLAAGAKAHAHVRINGACGMRLLASCAAGTTVEVRGNFKQE